MYIVNLNARKYFKNYLEGREILGWNAKCEKNYLLVLKLYETTTLKGMEEKGVHISDFGNK